MQAIFQTFFEIGCAVGLGAFVFGVVPSMLMYKFVIQQRR
jgi:hypothetical protein